MAESATAVSTARAPTVNDVDADSLATAKPEGPDLRRVSDSKGEKVGCDGCAGVDVVTDPPRAASLLTTLRGGAACGAAGRGAGEAEGGAGGGGAACGAAGRGTGDADAVARGGAAEGREALAPPETPPGSWLINCSSGISRCVWTSLSSPNSRWKRGSCR